MRIDLEKLRDRRLRKMRKGEYERRRWLKMKVKNSERR